MPPIDFTALEQKDRFKVGSKTIKFALIYIALIGAAIISTVGLNALHDGLGTIAFYFFFAVGAIASYFNYQINKKMWRSFASVNGWQILPAGSGLDFTPPSISGLGRSHKSSEVVSGQLAGQDFYAHTFQYTTGSGKNSQTHDTTILGLRLKISLPHLILARNQLLGSAVYPFRGSQRLKLEGDFDKYFGLYCADGSEIEALQVMTPDIMSFLITADKEYNIEFVDGWFYICAFGDARSPLRLQEMFADVISTNDQLQQNYNLSHTAKV